MAGFLKQMLSRSTDARDGWLGKLRHLDEGIAHTILPPKTSEAGEGDAKTLCQVYEAYSNVFDQLKVVERVKLPRYPNIRPKVKSQRRNSSRPLRRAEGVLREPAQRIFQDAAAVWRSFAQDNPSFMEYPSHGLGSGRMNQRFHHVNAMT
eukprot:s2123_g2.t1